MTKSVAAQLAELKKIADLIFDREKGRYSSVRQQIHSIDDEKNSLSSAYERAQFQSRAPSHETAAAVRYLDLLAAKLDMLEEKRKDVLAEEQTQKERLKSALATQLQLELTSADKGEF